MLAPSSFPSMEGPYSPDDETASPGEPSTPEQQETSPVDELVRFSERLDALIADPREVSIPRGELHRMKLLLLHYMTVLEELRVDLATLPPGQREIVLRAYQMTRRAATEMTLLVEKALKEFP